jgi:DNA-directed RNA polymerase delta subunit
MVDITKVIEFLDKKGKAVSFDKIFEHVKNDLPITHEHDHEMKAELLNSFISSSDIVRLEDNMFDLSSNYSIEELKRIDILNVGLETYDDEEEPNIKEPEDEEED